MEEIKSIETKSVSIVELADKLGKQHKDIKDLILAIREEIANHSDAVGVSYRPKTIMESRFIPAQEAFDRGMLSCGAMVNISAEILRHLGYRVKLIHGESSESVDHAWISVFDPETDSWTPYDVTRKGAVVPDTNIPKIEVDSWEEIKDQIIKDHETLEERRRERGLPKPQESEILKIEYPEIAKEIEVMRDFDQDMREKSLEDDSWDDGLDRKNTERMKEIIAEIGWPSISKVGANASTAAWLLVQHADHDVEFQSYCLGLMQEMPREEVRSEDVALLTDRVRVNKGLPQVYGTQFTQVDGKHVPRDIEDPENVDERRKLVGLDTLDENIKRMYKKYPIK